MKIDFYKHNLGIEEIDEVASALGGVFLTSGPRTKKFEVDFSNFLNCKYAIGMTSWTSAAFLVLKAWGIGVGDEVIVPSMTFIASANVVEQTGATPVFIDSDPITGNIAIDKLESLITEKTRAIMPVHLYGHMVDMKRLRSLADSYGLKILEDCAHCIEGKRDGIQPGQLSDAACFSFYATKNITSGEGGAVVTNDEELVDKLSLLRLHGMDKSAADRYSGRYQHWDMSLLGYKANMNDIQAAILLPQIKKMGSNLVAKEKICKYYQDRFNEVGIRYPLVESGAISARHLFTIWSPEGMRDDMLLLLQDKGVGVAVNFRPVHLMRFYREKYGFGDGDYPVAEWIGNHTITIPMYPKLTQQECVYVADAVIDSYQSLNA